MRGTPGVPRAPSKGPPSGSREGCDLPPPRALRDGIAQFNRGEFFEQHETLEDLWRDEYGPVRDLYHGILQIGVGLHHRTRGNRRGAISLIRRGIARLRGLAPECQQVDVASLITESAVVLAELESLDPAAEALAPAPVVRWRP